MINQTILRRIETNDETLKRFHIWSERELRQFITAVQENSNIQTLGITNVTPEIEDTVIIDPDVATALSAILPRMPFLSKFFICNCDCSSSDGLSILASALASKASLDSLLFKSCRIGNRGAQIIANSFGDNNTLKSLSLTSNPTIGNEGAIALASLFANNSKGIRFVNLMRNNIGADGMSALAASLGENQSVEKINLFGNTDEPDAHFKGAVYNDSSIESLIASNHTLLHIFPNHPDLDSLLKLNGAGPEKSVRAKIIRFLNEQPIFVLTVDIEGNVIPSYMEKIGRDCQLNTMFELMRNMPALFETG